MRIAIIGAGMAGLACATQLAEAGHDLTLFDKGRGPGGRMATRRLETPAGEAAFDHGAQYFTARNPAFQAEVANWCNAGITAPWPAAGPGAYIGTPAMNAPIKHMAAALSIRWKAQATTLSRPDGQWHLDRLTDTGFDATVIAIPAEQAAPLIAPWNAAFADRAKATPAQPCWTLMAAFEERLPAPDILREAGPIGWAARNNAKPGRTGPEAWTIQAGPTWSAEHLELTPDTLTPLLLAAFADRIGVPLPTPLATQAHRWRYARSGAAGEGALWDNDLKLGLCGDWLLGPRIECAWLSGRRLAGLMT